MMKETPSALVFGTCEQARAVTEGLLNTGYNPVYVFSPNQDKYLSDALGATLLIGDVQNPKDLSKAFRETKAQAIFLITTTELPTEFDQTTGFWEAEEAEYQMIKVFFDTLQKVHDSDHIKRHIVMSTRDNVQRLTREYRNETGEIWIEPLDDGTIVPHYTAKGKGGEYALALLKDSEGLSITLLTIPFLYSNFTGFFTPLPNEGQTQWTLEGCFGEADGLIDMMGASDLSVIVPNVLARETMYNGENLRLVGERRSMTSIAKDFSDLFGKDVIYNPLSVQEFSAMPYPMAPAVAQMCQFHGNPKSAKHDIALTRQVAFPKRPQLFWDWLLTHSDATAFQEVGLDYDSPEIKTVTVFNATSPEGVSVCRGLLEDSRKEYTIKAVVSDVDSNASKDLQTLSPDRIQLVLADFEELLSIEKALEGSDGAFLVTDFYGEAKADPDVEERHAKNVIDTCESVATVRHLVLCSMESIDEVNSLIENGLGFDQNALPQFDAKSRAAAYAQTKRLSVTYVLLPFYTEAFFELVERRPDVDGRERPVLSVPLKDDSSAMCMSIDDLGPAVANIFDSYQVYAGHELALVTEFISARDVKEIVNSTFDELKDNMMEVEEMSTDSWIQEKDSYMRDLGRLFQFMVNTDVVRKRLTLAKTLKLVPSARSLDKWIDSHKENVSFREKLGLS